MISYSISDVSVYKLSFFLPVMCRIKIPRTTLRYLNFQQKTNINEHMK